MAASRLVLYFLLFSASTAAVLSHSTSSVDFFQHIVRTNQTYPVSEMATGGDGGPEPGAFGYCVVFDHKLTQGSDYYSPEVGRARGTGCVVSSEGSVAHESLTVSLVGRNGDVTAAGTFALRQPISRLPVSGGTGEFYRAEGVYTSQVVATNGFNAIAHVTLTLRIPK